MKLALLGSTPAAVKFLQGALRRGHEVVGAYDCHAERTALLEALPTVRLRSDWENLLAQSDMDAVVVAGPALPEDSPSDVRERRDDQLRKLIQSGVPLIVLPPVVEAIVGFELEMIRRDVNGIVITAWGAPLHGAVGDFVLAYLSPKAGRSLGPIELVSMERYLPARSRSAVLAAFAHDAEILRRISGPLRRITASGGGSDGDAKPSLAGLSVHAASEASFPLRWSVLPAGEFAGAKLIVQGAHGQATLLMPASDAPWEMITVDERRSYDSCDTVAIVLSEAERALEKKSPPSISWLDACRATEAMEAIDRSLARARGIELHNEEHTEESSFKGIMAAGGCLLLLGTLTAVMCAGSLAVFSPPGKGTGASFWGWLQVALLTPLVIFLLAQLLSFGHSRHLRSKRDDSVAPGKPANLAD